MKDIIKNVLFRHKDYQPNLASESCRDLIATEIAAVVLSKLFDVYETNVSSVLASSALHSRNSNQLELNFSD